MTLSIIAAVARDGAIGRSNALLWHLPQDLRRFRKLTIGHPIMMGRKTFDSLPNGALPGRRNIVISKQYSTLPDAEVYPSIEVALESLSNTDEEVFIIGGGMLYQALLPHADKLYLTLVDTQGQDADTFFPPYTLDDWEVLGQEHIPADDANTLASTYYELKRKVI